MSLEGGFEELREFLRAMAGSVSKSATRACATDSLASVKASLASVAPSLASNSAMRPSKRATLASSSRSRAEASGNCDRMWRVSP
jgi:hypothetical protein